MNTFEPVALGHSALRVPPICLGTMTFGEQVDEATSHAILDRSVERGVNFLDTAEMYSVPARAETFGATETIIGNWLAKRPGMRERIAALGGTLEVGDPKGRDDSHGTVVTVTLPLAGSATGGHPANEWGGR